MNKYYIASINEKANNLPFAAALLCTKDALFSAECSLKNLSDIISFPENKNPVTLDLMLAHSLKKVTSREISAAAVTFSAWKNGPVAGSVIGNPHSDSSSADGELEKIGSDLWCCAYSCSPGFILFSERKTALKAQQIITFAKCLGDDPWPEFKNLMEKENVSAYIYVTDGSGANGFIAAKGANGYFETSL